MRTVRPAFHRNRLSRRESEVLAWLIEGNTNAACAKILGVSKRTIEKHCEHIYKKMGVDNRLGAMHAALVGMAVFRHLVAPDSRPRDDRRPLGRGPETVAT